MTDSTRGDTRQALSSVRPEEVPVCLQCLTPYSPLEHYCPVCGQVVGKFTPYIPFVNIPWTCDFWGKLWKRTWFESGRTRADRVFNVLLMIMFAPILLVGIPFALLAKVRRNGHRDHPPLCEGCNHHLTGNVSGTCPECGMAT